MSRIPVPAIEQVPAESQTLLASVAGWLGAIPNMHRLMATSPVVLEAFLGFHNALNKGSVDQLTRERIALAVAEANGSEYCLSAQIHRVRAGAMLDDAEITANRSGASNDIKADAAVRLAAKLARDRGRASEADIETMKRVGYSDAEIVEVIADVAINLFSTMINQALETDLDFPRIATRKAAVSPFEARYINEDASANTSLRSQIRSPIMSDRYKTVDVDGIKIFYREAGDPGRPVVLLLHGFPTASHMFRNLLPELTDRHHAVRYHVVAPDLPGFGMTEQPGRDKFAYTFENISRLMSRFTEVLGLNKFAIYVFDYGAPVGFRMAVQHPERISAIITQNGNTYLEGVSDAFAPIQAYWKEPTQANRDALRGFLAPQTTLFQYTQGVPDSSMVSPDGRNLDDFYLARPGNDEIQLDLLLDYQSNVAMYDTVQAYLRKHQPPVLAVWGKNDPFFIPAGAEAFKRDVPAADIRFFDSGHFALETHAREIGAAMREFLAKHVS